MPMISINGLVLNYSRQSFLVLKSGSYPFIPPIFPALIDKLIMHLAKHRLSLSEVYPN